MAAEEVEGEASREAGEVNRYNESLKKVYRGQNFRYWLVYIKSVVYFFFQMISAILGDRIETDPNVSGSETLIFYCMIILY